MRIFKKLLAACMLFGLFTVKVMAETTIYVNGAVITETSGPNWKYDQFTKTLTGRVLYNEGGMAHHW